MADEAPTSQALSFGGVADRYDRGRPTYPREAAQWLAGSTPACVLELGAGTGKLTEHLVALGHDVLATDPDRRMLQRLVTRAPGAHACTGVAERLPVATGAVDVLVAAQAFHWFDLDRAVPELARVLRPGGVLALVWNDRDESIPWVRRLGRLIGALDHENHPIEALARFPHFGDVEERRFRHWQTLDRPALLDLVASRSNIATLGEEERCYRLEQVSALYDDYGRGPDGMQLPYLTRCYRSTVQEPSHDNTDADTDTTAVAGTGVGEATAPIRRADLPRRASRVADGPDDGTLLIDFH